MRMGLDRISRAAAVGVARGSTGRFLRRAHSSRALAIVLLTAAGLSGRVAAQPAAGAAEPDANQTAPDASKVEPPASTPEPDASKSEPAESKPEPDKPAPNETEPPVKKADAATKPAPPTAAEPSEPPHSEPKTEPKSEEELESEELEPNLDVAARLGSGFMRGGQGGLTSGQRDPFTLDIEVMRVKDARFMYGGALRIELEDAKAVAGIARLAFRHRMGSIELRPGAGIPFYFAPRTMLGLEGSCGFRMPLSGDGLGFSGSVSAAAFMIGSDIPHGSTVIMFHVFLGIDLLL
jgi:hypothetical protein